MQELWECVLFIGFLSVLGIDFLDIAREQLVWCVMGWRLLENLESFTSSYLWLQGSLAI